MKDKAPRPYSPLVILHKSEKRSTDIGKYFLLILFGQVLDRRPDCKCSEHFTVFNDRTDDLDPVDRTDLDHIFIAYRLHSGGEPDRIEIFSLQAASFRFIFKKGEKKLRPGLQLICTVCKEILFKIICYIR